MDVTPMPRHYGAALPTAESRMALVHRLAARNPREGAGVGTWDLGAAAPERELVVNWRPCAQCYGATLWSGLKRLVIAGDGPELEELTGFDEGPMREDWAEQFRRRGIEVVSDVLREESLEVFAAYGRMAAERGLTVYNARGRT